MKINPGRMNVPMVVEKKTVTVGVDMAKVDTWQHFTSIMADKQLLNSGSFTKNRQDQVRYVYEIRTPMTMGIIPNIMRVYDTREEQYLVIRGVNDLENRGQILQLRCEVIE